MTTIHQNKTCIKKLMSFVTELENNPNEYYLARPNSDNILIWHVLIWNLDDEYTGGQYIMKITFPSEYPFKAPSFKFLTPNGKFDINQSICLSNSSYHDESWSPLWGIDQIMMGTISMFHEKNTSGVGHMSYNKQNMMQYAKDSVNFNSTKLDKIYNEFFC